MAGKGDAPRAVNGDVYRRNYDSIFAENLEQARLLAMSADREEKLVQQVAALKSQISNLQSP
jgi:hypothetical protein